MRDANSTVGRRSQPSGSPGAPGCPTVHELCDQVARETAITSRKSTNLSHNLNLIIYPPNHRIPSQSGRPPPSHRGHGSQGPWQGDLPAAVLMAAPAASTACPHGCAVPLGAGSPPEPPWRVPAAAPGGRTPARRPPLCWGWEREEEELMHRPAQGILEQRWPDSTGRGEAGKQACMLVLPAHLPPGPSAPPAAAPRAHCRPPAALPPPAPPARFSPSSGRREQRLAHQGRPRPAGRVSAPARRRWCCPRRTRPRCLPS